MIGIYKITNPKGKIYIGQSINIEKRFRAYKNTDCKNQQKLYNSFIKYGVDNHKFEIIQLCNIEKLNELEKYYVDLFQTFNNSNGLNLRDGGGSKGITSDITKEKQRISAIGQVMSLEARNKMSESRKKIILNTQTGIFYFGVSDAHSSEKKLSKWTLYHKLNGHKFNNTNFLYV